MKFRCICGHLRTRFLDNTQSWPSLWIVLKHLKTKGLRHLAPWEGFHLRTFADTELVSGRPCPEVRNSRNPAKSGHYPARRYFAWPSPTSDRKPLSLKHIRRHRASQIGSFAIYPAMGDLVRDQWLVARKRAEPSANSQPTDVRKCPQRSECHLDSNAATLCGVETYGKTCDCNLWLPRESRISANVRKSNLTSPAPALINRH